MQTINGWLNLFKSHMNFYSDYQLAKHWQIAPTCITQYRRQRLRLPLVFALEIAAVLQIEPLEIIVSLEFQRANELHKPALVDWYFCAANKTIGARMGLGAVRQWSKRRFARF